MLNRKIINFVKDRNDAIFPVEILVKFHYSQKHYYSYIGFINVLKELEPFNDGIKYKTDSLIFMTLDLENG